MLMSNIKDTIQNELNNQRISGHNFQKLVAGAGHSSLSRWLKGTSKSITTSTLDTVLSRLGLEITKKSKK